MRARLVSAIVLTGASLASITTSCGDSGSTGTGGATTSSSNSTGGGGAGNVDCLLAQGPLDVAQDTWNDAPYQATMTSSNPKNCARMYSLFSTAPLHDPQTVNPRSIEEEPGQPVTRTGNDMFDGLYAMAIDETREASVDAIHDLSFNAGMNIPCAAGGCFETGKSWTYVWTRDTSYSTFLGLPSVDPTRTRNSMEFKTSPHRDGTLPEIVQDTGTGGSWPVSSDRVVWAMGAWELLQWLDGAERTAFRDLAYEAMKNTADHDRLVVFDTETGLYRGEQSFLDWRQQSYPAFTATDPAQIAMSESLGTNVAHLRLFDILADLATEKGDSAANAKYSMWASSLRSTIGAKFWLPDRHAFSAFLPSRLDRAPVDRMDLLASALVVLADVATPSQAADVVSHYPHFPKGAPVIFPEQQDTPIYHNRAIWPFVTAFWAKAAAKVGNADAVDHAVRSLVRGAALYVSNMENFEVVTGKTFVEEGTTSGPVVDSERQLWSVAGYLSMVQEIVFGLETTQTGIRFAPKITWNMRSTLFKSADVITLSNLRYKGKRIGVRVHFPPAQTGSGFLSVASVKLDGQDVGTDFIDAASIGSDAVFDVELAAGTAATATITSLDDTAIADYQNVFGPHTPSITGLSIVNNHISVAWDAAGETDVTFAVWRDGALIAPNLPSGTTSFEDPNSADHAATTHCYAVESIFTKSQNASQHSQAQCYWGALSDRVQTFGAQGFVAQGGVLSQDHGKWHYDGWGAPSDTLTIANVVPTYSGQHLLQVNAGNGSGNVTTGITCGVKALEVWDGATLVASGQLVMPQLGDWDTWRDSSFVSASLQAGKVYTVIIREDAATANMSDLSHFALYNGPGGIGGRFDKVNIAELKLLALGVP